MIFMIRSTEQIAFRAHSQNILHVSETRLTHSKGVSSILGGMYGITIISVDDTAIVKSTLSISFLSPIVTFYDILILKSQFYREIEHF